MPTIEGTGGPSGTGWQSRFRPDRVGHRLCASGLGTVVVLETGQRHGRRTPAFAATAGHPFAANPAGDRCRLHGLRTGSGHPPSRDFLSPAVVVPDASLHPREPEPGILGGRPGLLLAGP